MCQTIREGGRRCPAHAGQRVQAARTRLAHESVYGDPKDVERARDSLRDAETAWATTEPGRSEIAARLREADARGHAAQDIQTMTSAFEESAEAAQILAAADRRLAVGEETARILRTATENATYDPAACEAMANDWVYGSDREEMFNSPKEAAGYIHVLMSGLNDGERELVEAHYGLIPGTTAHDPNDPSDRCMGFGQEGTPSVTARKSLYEAATKLAPRRWASDTDPYTRYGLDADRNALIAGNIDRILDEVKNEALANGDIQDVTTSSAYWGSEQIGEETARRVYLSPAAVDKRIAALLPASDDAHDNSSVDYARGRMIKDIERRLNDDGYLIDWNRDGYTWAMAHNFGSEWRGNVAKAGSDAAEKPKGGLLSNLFGRS